VNENGDQRRAGAERLATQEGRLGSASALLGMGQFATGAVLAPVVGLGGSHDAVPMGILIGVCGLAARVVNLLFTGPAQMVAPRVRKGPPGPTDAERSEAQPLESEPSEVAQGARER
jgi:hypothetical protein